MSIFINMYKSHAGQLLLPISWFHRKIQKVLVCLAQSQNCECLKDNTTHCISHSLVDVAQRPWEEHISPKLPEPSHALFPPKASFSSLGIRASFLPSGTMMSAQENTGHIPPQDRHNFGGPAQSEIVVPCGPSSNIVMNFKMEPSRGPSKL